MALRKSAPFYRAFTRYVFAVQYHGSNALGFSYQGPHGENCLVYQPNSHKTVLLADLRGVESVEGQLRRALDHLVGSDNYQNIKVSSRTDRGVHSWRNTFHVDIRSRIHQQLSATDGKTCESTHSQFPQSQWHPRNLVDGLNFYLARNSAYLQKDVHGELDADGQKRQRNAQASRKSRTINAPFNNTIRILSSTIAPDMLIPNPHHDANLPEDETNNPKNMQWDVRFTATRRSYAYRILHSFDCVHQNDDTLENLGWCSTVCHHSYPFEHDRVWRIHEKRKKLYHHNLKNNTQYTNPSHLDIDAMQRAGNYLIGTHDFTSFRGKGCQRSSPIVTIEDIWITNEKYHGEDGSGMLSQVFKRQSILDQAKKTVTFQRSTTLHTPDTLRLVTILIIGKSFLYHQVRNIVACLVEVGRGKLTPEDVKKILEKRDRRCAPGMAPPQGLFLVNVEHGDFQF